MTPLIKHGVPSVDGAAAMGRAAKMTAGRAEKTMDERMSIGLIEIGVLEAERVVAEDERA
jgi:hypothetical protein